MIQVHNLSFSHPKKDLYNRISFTLEDGQHCAFIGTSGSGKTTLLNLLMDPDRYTYDGVLQKAEALRIGYVSQFSQLEATQGQTVWAYLGEAFFHLQDQITTLCSQMETAAALTNPAPNQDESSPSALDSLMEAYQQAMDTFDSLGGDDFEARCERQLGLAGLAGRKDLPVTAISGGEFKLVQVMREMLLRPDLLIMDEPDAYLDFSNLHALKKLMNAHKGALLVITHNRYLLNHCFNKLIHLENQELQEFDGTYIDYHFSLLKTKIDMQELQITEDEEIARNEQLIERFRKLATLTNEESAGRKLKARVKVHDRLLARRIKAPFVAIRQPDIQFKTVPESAEEAADQGEASAALTVSGYTAPFDVRLFDQLHFEIGPSDKVALIGGNGTGKTTLLRDIYRNNQASIVLRPDLKVAYLSQQQGETLDETQTIYDAFFESGFRSYREIEDHLAPYGFEGDILNQKISALSGGERNLLQLARIGASQANLLLLDEPTSHLDTYAQIALEKAIQHYKGAVLMVSHDFHAIANCMDYVLLIEDRTIRRMSIRKFRQMVYAHHVSKDIIGIEQKKKALEAKIEAALQMGEFAVAKGLADDLAPLVEQLKQNLS